MKAAILSVAGPDLLAGEATLLAEHNPWGVILMGRSCVTRSQVQALVDRIWEAMGRACLIFIDQEGGRVARLKAPEWPVFPPAAAYGAAFARDAETGLEATWLGHRLMAAELAAMGIHADCSPVVDLSFSGAHDIIGDRAFGSDPQVVAKLARSALDGLEAGGVAGVIKHIPGHGRAVADSHLELPRVMAGDNELATDFAAFEGVNDAPMAMTAHIAYDSFDAAAPTTHSRRIVETVIRERIGFDGLLMTDDLGMKALEGTLAERARKAIAAGCDVLLHCSGFATSPGEVLDEMHAVADAAPELTGRALERAKRAEDAATRGEPIDLEAARARFGELMGSEAAA